MRYSFILLFALLITSAQAQIVKTGIEMLEENEFDILKGKKVGLITNPTGVNSSLKSTIDIFFENKSFTLTALYGPEHGVRGDFSAGDEVSNIIDKRTNIPVYSLYGKTRKPTPEMLKDIDVLVYDIQDIGCRSYTYISTLGLSMEAAAENNIEFVVLDRPNPLGGIKIEGNLVEEGFFSFVSQFNVPYVHGLTIGEFAKLLNSEKMLKDGKQCKLTVVPMFGWKRDMTFSQTGLPWVLTSPHIPYKESAEYYVSTGILGELGVISEGVGYTIPFQTFAAEWIDADLLSQKMNSLNLEGIIFRPISFKPYYAASKDKELHGVQLFITDFEKVNLMSLQFIFMEVHHSLYPDKNPFELTHKSRLSMFDKVCGTSNIRELFTKRMKYEDIKDYLNKDIEKFRSIAKKYYLYE
ncbi:MAG: DUF1343 domain-containing protein [Ignavibacteria bacterium]|nr:DUF1343 domain-containing protein [Ignavibacteria bacterium]